MSDLNGPRQTILVSCRADGKDNMCTLSWHSPTSTNPSLYSIFLAKSRFSFEMIKKSGVFCVNFMSIDDEDAVLFCGTKSGRDVDKFKETSLEKEECEKIDCVRIKQALAFAECMVYNIVEAGDHFIVIGKVVNSKVIKEGKRIMQGVGYTFTSVEG